MDVKTAGRTIDLFEAFSTFRRPASLSELAEKIGMPLSSCSNLVQTMQARGYLYRLRERGPFYPSRRLLELSKVIAAHDPILARVAPVLSDLRDSCNETVAIGTIRGSEVVYIEIFESKAPIRYSPAPGTRRPAYANSIGKAILGAMDEKRRAKILKRLSFKKMTKKTLLNPTAFQANIAMSSRRGWYENEGETIAEGAGVAVPVTISGHLFGVSISGPVSRMQSLRKHVPALKRACGSIGDESIG